MLPTLPADPAEAGSFTDIIAALDVPRVPQQERSRQKRDALVEAAARLFEERGYEATTADDIAAAAGVSIGTFYSYFRNKRQLFMTLVARCLETVHALRIAEIDLSRDPRAAIRGAIEQAMNRDALYYGMRRAWLELLPRDPELARYDREVNLFIYGQIVQAARRAAAAGLLWPALDVDATCWMVTVLLDRAWQIEPRPDAAGAAEVARQRDALADLVYRALFRQG